MVRMSEAKWMWKLMKSDEPDLEDDEYVCGDYSVQVCGCRYHPNHSNYDENGDLESIEYLSERGFTSLVNAQDLCYEHWLKNGQK